MSGQREVTHDDLKRELEELQERHPTLQDHEAFLVWFLRAYLTEDLDVAVKCVAGGPNDRSVDAVFVDDGTRSVFLVQSKYRFGQSRRHEARADVLAFASIAGVLYDDDAKAFDEHIRTSHSHVATLLREARKKLLHSGYRLWMYYVTLGECSPSITKEAVRAVRRARQGAGFETLDAKKVMLLFRDYLDGAAPPVPTLDLEMEAGSGVRVNGILQRFDSRNKMESWVFSMRGSAVADMFERAGVRLFARNIRGFMGENTPVNRGMEATLREQPDHFFYFNNGITIVCDLAERQSSRGRDILRVSNPQIINGQQTSRVLSVHADRSEHASVLVKVIQIARGEREDTFQKFDAVVSKIVQGTNWQNAIKPSDLMSNDRRQIVLERTLRKLGYTYLRKRQSKGEARRLGAGRAAFIIKKEDLAQAVAGCDLDPVVARSGKDNLFEEQTYQDVFPTDDAEYYLSRYWLAQHVSSFSRGYPQRGYMKWLVLGFVWRSIQHLLRTRPAQQAFRRLFEKKRWDELAPLDHLIETVYRVATGYYKANRGHGDTAVDVSLFFRSKRGRDRDFVRFWKTSSRQTQTTLERSVDKLHGALEPVV